MREGAARTKGAGVLGWLVLLAAWVFVMVRGSGPTPTMVAAPFLLMIGASALMGVWVRHNISLQQRLGPRRAVPAVVTAYDSDRLGRMLTVDNTPRHAPRWVQIDLAVQADRKHYFRP